ncbi:MAG: phosphatidate cytidylyltransferase [Planctomycetota bacterium]
MILGLERELVAVYAGVLALLVIVTIAGTIVRKRAVSESAKATAAHFAARTKGWWVMSAVFGLTILLGTTGILTLFGVLSFLALREFITLTPTRRSDHRVLFWSFFLLTPLQYVMVGREWVIGFTTLIPVYAFLLLPVRIACAGDTERFLERAATIQWGLMVCVYCLSHAPALLSLEIKGRAGGDPKLLLFLVLVVQLSDALQYAWGNICGWRKIAPTVSPRKTVEGSVLGIACATFIGGALWWLTPFSFVDALWMSLAATLMGFGGGLVMSAIKRDRRIEDYGGTIDAYGGILDRIDCVCFAAPVFFHFTRYFYAGGAS